MTKSIAPVVAILFGAATLGCTARGPLVPGDDAAVLDGDAATAPDAQTDAQTETDTWIDEAPDAWSGRCPTFVLDVAPIYQLHCAPCHTTGLPPHFATDYAVATSPTSTCGSGVPMVACTIQLGRPTGAMSHNDPLGGFTGAEIATISAWVNCGEPM